MNYVQVSNNASGNPVKIHYNDCGIGKPVVLIHGWPLSGDMWEYQINNLINTGHRVITYDWYFLYAILFTSFFQYIFQ